MWTTLRTIVSAVVVLVVGAGVAAGLMATRTTTTRTPSAERAPLVAVLVARSTSERVTVTAHGTVVAAREVAVGAQVSGVVTHVSPSLIAGGIVAEGDVLARLDDSDYRDLLTQRDANLQDALHALALEEGNQAVARREWALMDESETTDANRRLVLRQTHLARSQAAVSSARSALQMAQRDIDRTVIRAPFNAIVRRKGVETGQIAGQQTVIAELVGTDEYHVRVNVPTSLLQFVRLPDRAGSGGATAAIVHDLGRGVAVSRKGTVVRLLGSVEQKGNMAQLLVEIARPLEGAKTPLLLGAYVRVEIEGAALDDVIVVPRVALHEGDKVWVMDDEDRLDVRQVTIAWRRAEDVYVASGISAGDRVITSHLSSAVDGTVIRTEQE